MTGVKEILCRLCRKNITDKGFQVIDSVTRDMLDVLLLKLKFSDKSKEVICNACKRKLRTALDFKSTCLNTDNTIIPHVDCEEMKQFDLGEIYVKENGSGQLMGISGVRKICRLCMQLIKGEIRAICEEELEDIHKFAPEMYISIIKDPVLCEQCFDSLSTHNTFLKNCSEVEQSIPDIFESSATESRTAVFPSDLFIKNKDVEKGSEIKEEEISIKSECVDIKSENEEESDTLLLHSNNERFENRNCIDAEDKGLKYTWKHKNRSIEKCGMKSRKKSSPLYKCEICDFKTKYKLSLNRHGLRHKDPSEVQIYRCNDCNFSTIYKKSLRSHTLVHRDPSQCQIYKCNDCNYKTNRQNCIYYHAWKHKDPSQMRIYKCDACNYESRRKYTFTQHQLTHKNLSEVQIYRCNDCNFASKYKGSLMNHVVVHKDPSQCKIYRCNDCNYKTNVRCKLYYHARIHKNPAQVQMYKCDACDFVTTHKLHFTRHQLTHKGLMYQCNECDFKTQYKQSLVTHLLRHNNSSQVQMYKCDACDYESKYKSRITNHQLKHKDSSEVQMHHCNQCSFKTKYKRSLATHLLGHKNSSSANVYM